MSTNKALRVQSLTQAQFLELRASGKKALRVYDINGGGDSPDLTAIKDRLTALEKAVSDLQNKVQVNADAVSKINTGVQDLFADVNDIGDDIQTNIDNIAKLNQVTAATDASLKAVTTNVSDLTAEVVNVDTDIQTNIDDIAKLNQVTTTIDANLKVVTTDVSDVKDRIAPFETEITDLQGKITPLESDYESLKTVVNDVSTKYSDLKFGLDSISDIVSQLTNVLTPLTQSVVKFDDKISLAFEVPIITSVNSTGLFVKFKAGRTLLNRTFMGGNDFKDYEVPCCTDTEEPFEEGTAITNVGQSTISYATLRRPGN